MERLLQGHGRFRAGFVEREKDLFRRLAEASHQPCYTLAVTCSDSRVVPELIVDARPGELFVVRNVANIVPPRGEGDSSVGAVLEYALGHLPDMEQIVVWGHYGCGGIKALLEGTEALVAEPALRAWVTLAEEALRRLEREEDERGAQERWDRLVELNVVLQMDHLLGYPVVAEAVEAGRVRLNGWVYDLATARLKAYHEEHGFQWVE
jgi:carbonic anhydrase